MAADGRCTADDTIIGEDEIKLFRAGRSIVGLAGAAGAFRRFVRELEEGKDAPFLPKGTSALVLLASGEVRQYDPDGWSPTTPPAAIGSGKPHALSAMDCGLGAEEAVRMAILRDPFSGGKVHTMSLPKAARKRA